MTIAPGAPWGRAVPRPAGLETVSDDRSFVEAWSSAPAVALAVVGGDLHRTLGRPDLDGRHELNELPLDLIEARIDDGEPVLACAHVVARRPWSRGGWWTGPALVVMNAEFRGEWDVAPRGHPNDGRVETFEVDASFGLRDRWTARRRAPAAGHVPHPDIRTRSVRTAQWNFPVPLEVVADGRRVGRGTRLAVTVVPDAAVVHA